MKKANKVENIKEANLLAEQRYLEERDLSNGEPMPIYQFKKLEQAMKAYFRKTSYAGLRDAIEEILRKAQG